MKIYVDENKGDRNSFYLLAYVYGEDSDISSFQQAASVVKARHPRLGSSFKGIRQVFFCKFMHKKQIFPFPSRLSKLFLPSIPRVVPSVASR